MSKAECAYKDELSFIDACIAQAESDDPGARIFARLQRDVMLAYLREKRADPESVHLVSAVINVLATLTVNVILSTARSGQEGALMSIILRTVERRTAELLAASPAARVEMAAAAK